MLTSETQVPGQLDMKILKREECAHKPLHSLFILHQRTVCRGELSGPFLLCVSSRGNLFWLTGCACAHTMYTYLSYQHTPCFFQNSLLFSLIKYNNLWILFFYNQRWIKLSALQFSFLGNLHIKNPQSYTYKQKHTQQKKNQKQKQA